MPPYWMVAVPTHVNAQQTENDLVRAVQGLVTSNSPRKFEIPELKIGTMETLLAMQDDLGRYDIQIEQIVKKLSRAYSDLVKTNPDVQELKKDGGSKQPQQVPKTELLVNEKDTPVQFVEAFSWLSRKFPPHAALKDLTDIMLKDALKADDELKQYLSSYNEIRIVLEGMDRKEGGSLLVKPLAPYLASERLIDTEHLTTMLLVIPKKEEQAFLNKYETMEVAYGKKEEEREAKMKKDKEEQAKKDDETKKPKEEQPATEKAEPQTDKAAAEKAEAAAKAAAEEKERLEHEARMARLPKCDNVVPRSAKKLTSDEEFVLYSIIVFKKGLELIRNVCRQERYTVRVHQHDPNEETRAKEARKKLTAERKKKYGNAILTTKSSFSDTFVIWMHIKAMRVFVEVVTRYGLPVNYQCYLLKPKKNMDKKLRESLSLAYKHLPMDNKNLPAKKKNKAEEEEDEVTLSQFGTFYPYVYFEIDLAFEEEGTVNFHT